MEFMDYEDDFSGDRVFIITGPPGSGKSTWVKEHRSAGDIAVDLDYILAALRLDERTHLDCRDVLQAGIAVKDFLIDSISKGTLDFARAFIITTTNVDEIQQLTGGTILEMNTDMKTIVQRIKADDRLTDQEKQRRIDIVLKYFYKKRKQDPTW